MCKDTRTTTDIKFTGNAISVVSDSKILASLNLCTISIDTNNYTHTTIKLTPGQKISYLPEGISYKNVFLKVIYDATAQANEQLLLFKTNNYKYSSVSEPKVQGAESLTQANLSANIPTKTFQINNPFTSTDIFRVGNVNATAGTDFIIDASDNTVTITNLITFLRTKAEINDNLVITSLGTAITFTAKNSNESNNNIDFQYISTASNANAFASTKFASTIYIPGDYGVIHNIMFLDSNTLHPITELELLNPTTKDINIEMILTK